MLKKDLHGYLRIHIVCNPPSVVYPIIGFEPLSTDIEQESFGLDDSPTIATSC